MSAAKIVLPLLGLLCVLVVATETRAQRASGYTSLDYYADTDTLDSYYETDMDDSLVGDYDAFVSLRITDPSGNILCADSARDNAGTGVISVGCSASGTTLNTTYTAVGFHKPIANLWDYYSYYPYRLFYYDDYNFTSFEGRGISEPWYYDFYSPGFQAVRRNTAPISVGSTYDSDLVTTPPGGSVAFKTAKIYQGTQGEFAYETGIQRAHLSATASQCNPSSNFTLTVNYNPPEETHEITQVTAKGFGNSSVSNWNVEADTINNNYNLSSSPPTGTVSMTVNYKNGGRTRSPYDRIQVTVRGTYNSGQSFSTTGSVHIQCP